MKLSAFRITRYRSIMDSGWVNVDPLTVLVGKNESGKTSLLKALHKFNPFDPEPYSLDREWPRSQRRSRNEQQVVVTTRFELNPEESEIIAAFTGSPAPSQLEISRDYKGRLHVGFPEEMFGASFHPNPLDGIVDELPAIPATVGDAFRDQARRATAEMKRVVLEGRFSRIGSLADAQAAALKACMNPWNPAPAYENEQEYLKLYVIVLDRLRQSVSSVDQNLAVAHEAIVERLPTFILMDEYHSFRGSAMLDEVHARKQNGLQTPEDRTLEIILELAGLSLSDQVKNAKEQDREQRQYDLDDAALHLTKAIEGRWKQLRYEVKFAGDGNNFFTFVKDERDQGLLKLEERSKGFQWFFSFDLMLMYESRGQFRNCVVLLDEPGLSLHPDAQHDLLRRLDEYSESNTLIYATHLPFLINLDHPERLRVLNESTEGTVVSADLSTCQPEAKTTLEAALAIGCGSSLHMAPRNLVIEGLENSWLLSELSNLFVRSGLAALPSDLLITPASTVAQSAYLATLMVGQKYDAVVLLTTVDPCATGPDGLMRRWLTRYHSDVAAEMLHLGAIMGRPDRELGVEDLFPDDFYHSIVKKLYGREMSRASLKRLDGRGPERLSRRTENFLADSGVRVSPRAIAAAIRTELCKMKSVEELPGDTRAKAERVFKATSQVFNKEKNFWAQQTN